MPVLAVLDRLRTGPRFGLVVAVVMMPALLSSGLYVSHLDSTVAAARDARSAAVVVRAVLVQQAAILLDEPDVAADPTALAAAVDAYPHPVTAPMVTVSRLSDAAGRAAAAAELADLAAHVQSGSQFGSGLERDTGTLASVLALDMPAALAAMAALSAPVPAGDGIGSGDGDQMAARSAQAGVLAAAAGRLRQGADTFLRGQAPGERGLAAAQLRPLLSAADALDELTLAVDRRIVDASVGRTLTGDLGERVLVDHTHAAKALRKAVAPTAAVLDHALAQREVSAVAEQRASIGFIGLALAVAAWIGLATAWRTRSDVARIVAAVRAMAAGTDEPVPLPHRRDEFADVSRALVAARERLAAAQADLARQGAERELMLREAKSRQRLLEHLVTIQRAIAARHPLQHVLDLVTTCAADVLDDAIVGIVLVDPHDGAPMLKASFGAVDQRHDAALLAAGRAAVESGGPARVPDLVRDPVTRPAVAVAIPVQLAGTTTGGLVALLPVIDGEDQRSRLLQAFAQQVTLAISDARNAEEILEAYHDELTGLPTRSLFLDRLTRALETAEAAGDDLALLFIDLDRFKSVNDTLGHQAGDELLSAVARRLRACLRRDDSPARLGGDEFAVLLPHAGLEAAGVIAQRIIDTLRNPFVVAGQSVAIDSSIGIAVPASDPAHDPEAGAQDVADRAATLLSSADVAMYRAKKRGGGHVIVFESRMREEAMEHLRVVTDMREALAARQFHVEYQPLVRLADSSVAGVEALVRWRHPDRGLVPPDQFIPVAEEIGVIGELGRWVLQCSLRDFAGWQAEYPDLQLNVNVSGRQLADSSFPRDLADELREAGVRPGALTLELTETVLMNDLENAPRQLSRLKMLGVRLAVDDFGTGYSSLTYLRRLPVDDVKIDRAFVQGLGRDPRDLAVVKTVLDLATTLRLRTVAEGIEHPGQVEVLRRLGCHLGQGFLFARPMGADRVPDAIADSRTSDAGVPM